MRIMSSAFIAPPLDLGEPPKRSFGKIHIIFSSPCIRRCLGPPLDGALPWVFADAERCPRGRQYDGDCRSLLLKIVGRCGRRRGQGGTSGRRPTPTLGLGRTLRIPELVEAIRSGGR